jgi:hypothetical protein
MNNRLLLVLGLIVLLAGSAVAGDTYVASSAPTGGCNHFPFNPTWSGSNGEWRYQGVFTATQLGNAPLLITGLSFAPCSTGGFTAKQLEIRMNNLPPLMHSTAFDTNIGASPTVVRIGAPITWNVTASTWCAIPLDCPHLYDGKSDLVVEVRYMGGGLTGSFTGPVVRDSVAPRYYAYGTGAYTTTTATGTGTAAFRVRLTHADVTPSTLSPSIGTTVNLALDSYPDAGGNYVTASSFGTGPFMVGCWPVKLDVDSLFFITVNNLVPTVFQNYQGVLDATGQATAAVAIPNVNALVGIILSNAFAVVGPGGLTVVSDNGVFRINP